MTNNNISTLSPKELSKLVTPKQRQIMKKCQEAYVLAKAWNDTNLAIDLEARQEELNAFEYYTAKDSRLGTAGDRVSDPEIDYLIDKKSWDEYFHAVYDRRKAKGWSCNYKLKDAPEYLVSADAESRPVLRLAEDVLIDACIETLPPHMRVDLKKAKKYPWRDKLINIALKWDTNN